MELGSAEGLAVASILTTLSVPLLDDSASSSSGDSLLQGPQYLVKKSALTPVPRGHLSIAQRFNVGKATLMAASPGR